MTTLTEPTDTLPFPEHRLLYTPIEAARVLGIGRSTLYELLANGEIASVHIGTSRRIPAVALETYVEAEPVTAPR